VAEICLCILLHVADFIRHPAQMTQQLDMIRQLPSQSLIPMFDGVNVVSSCAWMINKPVSFSVCFGVTVVWNLQFCNFRWLTAQSYYVHFLMKLRF